MGYLMSENEKKRFASELIENIRQDIFNAIPHMPDSWDGIELRQYIADKFREAVMSGTMSAKRKREYSNEIITNGRL